MANIAEHVSKLEIKKGEKKLQSAFFNYSHTFLLGQVITKIIKKGGSMAGAKCDRNDLTHRTTADALRKILTKDAKTPTFRPVPLLAMNALENMLHSFREESLLNIDKLKNKISKG